MIVEGVFESCFHMTSVKRLVGIVEMSVVCKNKFSMFDISTENNNEYLSSRDGNITLQRDKALINQE